MKKNFVLSLLGILLFAVAGYFGYVNGKPKNTAISDTPKVLKVVSAENFYGDIIKQLGGSHVQVLSILSDPNTDPHQYESSVRDGKAVANADFVLKNGDGYDSWIDKLLSASPNKKRLVLTATAIADHKLPDNPHVWYGFRNILTIAGKITDTLKQMDPKNANEYSLKLAKFNGTLDVLQQKIGDIKAKYNGTPIALTETIYLYQTQEEGLNVLTPFSFEKAIAEGNDPSADDVAKTNDQITKKQVKILIYNMQTVTPITTNLQNEAKQANIPIVPVSETLPTGKHYQDWMMAQLTILQTALQMTK